MWGLATHSTYAGSGDEPHYLAIAHSIAFDWDVDLRNNYGAAEPLIGGGALAPEFHTRDGAGGTLRPVHDVGMPFIFAPYVRVVRPLATNVASALSPDTLRRFRLTPGILYRHLLSAGMAAVAIALALQLFGAFREAEAPVSRAVLWSLLIVLSPPLLVMSILFFTETLSALLCLAALRVVSREVEQPTYVWFFAAMFIGILPLVHVRNVGLALPLVILGVTALLRGSSRSRLVLFVGTVGVFWLARTVTNYVFWGSWLTSPHARVGEWTGWGAFWREVGTRLGGLLIDQEVGLLVYAPLYMLAPWGLFAMWRTQSKLARAIAAVTFTYVLLILLPITNAHGWAGGWSPAARFLTPVVPLLGLAVAAAPRLVTRGVVASLIVVQVALNAYFWQRPKDLWSDADGVAMVCERHGLTFCAYLPSFSSGSAEPLDKP